MTTERDRYEDQPQGTQILWGRVLVLLLALALAFWLGTTFGGDGAAQQELTAQRNEIARLEAQIATMEAEIAAVDADSDVPSEDVGGDAASETAVDADTTAQRDDASDPPSENGQQRRGDAQERDQRYVIQSGDSLASIAQEVYGDPTRWREIARANNLEEPYALTVGASLRIPDAP